MNLRWILLLTSLPFAPMLRAQTDTVPVTSLDSVIVRAFEQNRRLRETPAAVYLLTPRSFERFGP
ncbi:MAG TPA: hypothetical protein VHK69_20800, partial [Chitinophagaceae bacterium]|nr:hypothetical protein [Chitinophagaceae bacterium]